MVRVDGDHVNWVLVIILVVLALLLAMVSSTGYGSPDDRDTRRAVPEVFRGEPSPQPLGQHPFYQPSRTDSTSWRPA